MNIIGYLVNIELDFYFDRWEMFVQVCPTKN